MPVNVTYPGVYIDEVKSSVRTITGVPTSVAAFVGYAPRGPADRPVHITGWADYEAAFGGLQANCPMSYAVYQFYLNGGSEAEIVRVVKADEKPVRLPLGPSAPGTESSRTSGPPPKGNESGEATAEGGGGESPTPTPAPTPAEEKKKGRGGGEPAGGERSSGRTHAAPPALVAVSPGRWGRNLRARVDHDTPAELEPEKGRRTLFNLTVRDVLTGEVETYLNASVRPDSPRNLANLLETSKLVRVDPQTPIDTVPPPNSEVEAGVDPFSLRPDESAQGQLPYYAPAEANKGADDDERSLEPKDYMGNAALKTGLHQLLKTDIFNILCLPDVPWLDQQLKDKGGAKPFQDAALKLCVDRRAILLVDPPPSWTEPQSGDGAGAVSAVVQHITDVEAGDPGKNAAVYYPQILAPDPLRQGALRAFPPSGVMAGVLARTDVQRGVWKAPAGTDASLTGVSELEVPLTDLEIGRLNPLGVNCLRRLPAAGPVAWGARTLRGADRLADEWKYLPVRRLALFIEESLFRGTHWVVFEPNDEPLWASIRLNVGAFMNSLFRAGAFQGRTPQEAYLVKCDKDTNPQNDIDRGIVNIHVGFAPLKPAEFVIVHIQQLAGQIQV
ncbi:hypothetical protein SUDANB105_06571 [Streptomyces sp. enrichment culture]|uniref:phage tail sheath family protein n=1 Tax=Streptomyces sp. enrichment culture TaxID=1795815 RepID=UPI003F556108